MGAIAGLPHPFPYQGSKRLLASQILACLPSKTRRLMEPFAGSGAITIAAAFLNRSERFLLSDSHQALIELWKMIIHHPDELADGYESLWQKQEGQERTFYDQVRSAFNTTQEPHCFLYLLARCVKAAIRYNGKGQFNNSPDNRRLGMHPDSMRRNLRHTSDLLRGKTQVMCCDYRETLLQATPDDVVYLDPPYQGVCETRNHRYCSHVEFEDFVQVLEELNRRNVPFIVSYDGRTGDKLHGQLLPEELELARFEIHVGRSTQATLLGRSHVTVESLYLSPAILERLDGIPDALCEDAAPTLFSTI